MRYLDLEEVIYIYTEVIQRTNGQPGLNDERLLESVLAKPLVTFEGEELYPDLFTKVAVLMYAIITTRPFVDGNKRTAVICAMFILRSNGYQIITSQDSLIELVTGASAGKYQVDQIVRWFKKNAVPV